MRHSAVVAVPLLVMALLAGCKGRTAAPGDSAFAAVQTRGHVAMGVDQYTSTHDFEPLPDGGRILLVRDSVDPAGVDRIRAHMAEIAEAFRRGDFTVPGFVHDRAVPGTAIMAERRSRISYLTEEVPQGSALRLRSTDPVAIAAIHEFLAFQRRDHRSPHAGAAP